MKVGMVVKSISQRKFFVNREIKFVYFVFMILWMVSFLFFWFVIKEVKLNSLRKVINRVIKDREKKICL